MSTRLIVSCANVVDDLGKELRNLYLVNAPERRCGRVAYVVVEEGIRRAVSELNPDTYTPVHYCYASSDTSDESLQA